MSTHGVYFSTPLERIRTFMTVEPLGALSVEEVALVTQNCEERIFGKGQALCRQGAAPDSFHVIVDGEVEVSGPEHGQAVLGPGRTLGLLTMLSRLEAGLEATARSDARTLEMSAEVLSEVMEDRISILFSLIRRITRETLALRRKVPDGARLGGAQRFSELESAPRIDLVARLRVLRRGSLFRRAGVGTLVQMATAIEERRAPAGTVLWRAGDPTGYFYLVIGGTVACRRPGGATFFAEAGYPLGNLESQAGEPRWYTAVAETPVILLRGSTEKFRDVLEDNPDVAMDFLGQVALGRINVAREPLSTR